MRQNFLRERHNYGWSPPLQAYAILSTFAELGGPGTSYFPPHDSTVIPHKTSKFNDKQINTFNTYSPNSFFLFFLFFWKGKHHLTPGKGFKKFCLKIDRMDYIRIGSVTRFNGQ